MLKWIRSLVTVTKFVPVNPGISPDYSELSHKDREAIAAWLANETTQRVLALMEARRPSVYIHNSDGRIDQFGLQAATNRLHQLQGWETFRNTLLNLPKTPQEIREIVETFSDPSQ